MTIDGRQVRLEANWNALIGFLQETGKDDLGALADLKTLRPSDLAGLMAACINEGERLEGRESSYTARTLGEVINASDVLECLRTFRRTRAKKKTDSLRPGQDDRRHGQRHGRRAP